MTREKRESLLKVKDLYARLLHGVKCCLYNYDDNETYDICVTNINHIKELDIYMVTGYDDNSMEYRYTVEAVKPYLRPMSSMTEEERKELSDYIGECVESDKSGITFPPDPLHGREIPFGWMQDCLDWLNANFFDYRGLIPMGSALPARKGMYNI